MKILFKRSIENFYKVEFDEINTIGGDGVPFTSVWTKKYLLRGDSWLFIDQYVYTEWTINSLSKFYIEKLGYFEGA